MINSKNAAVAVIKWSCTSLWAKLLWQLASQAGKRAAPADKSFLDPCSGGEKKKKGVKNVWSGRWWWWWWWWWVGGGVFGLELLQRSEEENPTLSHCSGSYIYLSFTFDEHTRVMKHIPFNLPHTDKLYSRAHQVPLGSAFFLFFFFLGKIISFLQMHKTSNHSNRIAGRAVTRSASVIHFRVGNFPRRTGHETWWLIGSY